MFPRERFRANSLAAWVALELSDEAEAEARFAAARAFDPDAADLRVGEARAGLALAESYVQAGRTLLRAGAEERAKGEARIEAALDRLQLIALDRGLPDPERARARKAAGWIQLWLGRLPNAERHFRASLELSDDDDAALGLAQTLVARADALEPGPARDAIVEEARRLGARLDQDVRTKSGLDARLRE